MFGADRIPKGKARLKEIIDEHLHREGFAAVDLAIEVEDRIAAGGARTIYGNEVTGAHGGFIDLEGGGRVPFHKVRRVLSGARVLYTRPEPD